MLYMLYKLPAGLSKQFFSNASPGQSHLGFDQN